MTTRDDPITPSHDILEVNGLKMHVAWEGEGPPLILLHGFPELWYSWRKLMPLLSNQYKVIAPDMRGYGQTDIPKTGYDLDTLAADVAALIDQVGGQAAVVGHDWGGLVAWHTAIVHPEKVSTLVAVSAPHMARHLRVLMTSPAQFVRGFYVILFQTPFLPELILSAGRGRLADRIMRNSARRPGAFDQEDMEIYRKAWSNRDSMRAGIDYYRKLMRGLPGIIRRYNRDKVRCPVSVVWADSDRFLSVASSRKLDRWCEVPPEIHIIKDCGHWVPQEAPSELCAIIVEFLDRRASL